MSSPLPFRLLAAAALSIALSPSLARAQGGAEEPRRSGPDEPFLRVGEREVSREEYSRYLLEKFGERALDRFVTDLLVKEEAKRRGVTATEEEKAAWVASTVRENREDPDFFPWLQAQGLTLKSYEEVILPAEAGAQVCLDKMVRAEMTSEEGLVRIFEERYGERLGVKVILVRDDEAIREEGDRWARQRLREARARLDAGEPFETLAREYSESPDAAVGGDLGFVGPGRLDPALEKAIFSLAPGEAAGPLESDFGYHLVQVVRRREGRVRARHILIRSSKRLLRDPQGMRTLEERLDADRRAAILASATARAKETLESLRLGADFSTVAAQESSHPSVRQGGEIEPFRPGSGPLPPAVEAAAAGLEVGGLAGPIEGDLGCYIVRLVSRQEQVKTFDDVREAIRKEAVEGPVPPEAISRFVRDLREGVKVVAPGLRGE